MFLIPIGHESDKVRRLPWISFVIMAACFLIHIFVSIDVNKKSKELMAATEELLTYYIDHPYLELDQQTKDMFFGERFTQQMEEMLDLFRGRASREAHPFRAEEQERLNQISQRLLTVLNDFPYRKWGFIPAKKSVLGLLGYMFIHGGWLHLLGNLLLLFLTGPFIEDVWGRPIFTAFYLVVGMLAALMYAQHYPHFTGPLIGASGAIAGIMGAFLVRYWKTKIKFFYWFLIFFRGTFRAPAWLMLPLWLFLELFNARVIDKVNPEGGGVAHWAHVWGFVFGGVIALGIKYFKVEEKYIHPKIESQITFIDEGLATYEEALEKRRDGNFEEAFALFLDAARKKPLDKDVVENLWDLGKTLGKEGESARFFVRLIESEIRRNKMEVAWNHFRDLREKAPKASIHPTCKYTLIEYLTERMDYVDAKKIASELIQEVDLSSPPILLQKFATVALKIDQAIAKKAIELSLQHPEIPQSWKEEFKIKFDDIQKRKQEILAVSGLERGMEQAEEPQTVPAESGVEEGTAEPEDQEAVEPSPDEDFFIARMKIKAVRAAPISIKEGKMLLEVEETDRRSITLSRIHSIAVAEISNVLDQSFLVIDLFLDDPKSGAAVVRSIRLYNTDFDPMKFFPDIQDSQEALKAFISDLLRLSGATALPDQDSALLTPPKRFVTVIDYEKSITSKK